MASQTTGQYIPPSNPESIKQRASIMKTFWYMVAITVVEFIIAFTKGPYNIPHLLVLILFIGLTLVKAFFIVAEFMHLKHEVRILILAIVLPVAFIIWFIVSMLYEGSSVLMVR